MDELLKDELLKDEELLWTGRPEVNVLFTFQDIFLIPFGLLWCGFIFFGVMDMYSNIGTSKGDIAGLIIFFIFFIIGLYFLFGRFVYKIYKKKNTCYAVTNKRVIIITKFFSKNIQAVFINGIPTINKSIRKTGIGIIRFGNSSYLSSFYANTGLDFFGSFYGQECPTFYDIKDAERVYQLVNELRKRA